MVQPSQVKKYIAASTPIGLERLMLKNNNKYGFFLAYDNIQHVDGKWYAWFYIDVERVIEKEGLNGAVE